MTSITGQLADFCAGLRTHAIPEPVLAHTAAVVLDWLSAALAGASSESGAFIRQLEPLLGGPREASVVGCAQRASLCLAALHNGTSSSVHELDDGHRDAAIHPGVVVIPAARGRAGHYATGRRAGTDGWPRAGSGAASERRGGDVHVRPAAPPVKARRWHRCGLISTE
jgi:2-methylcitrate dehydratase PrpD